MVEVVRSNVRLMSVTHLPFVASSGNAALKAIEASIVNAEWQGRRGMQRHPILMSVAEKRARFVCNVPDIFVAEEGHTFPGVVTEYGDGNKGTNWWAVQEGYVFPKWYPIGDKVNSIESIASGYKPKDVVAAWLNSPAHKDHLTGKGNFFAGQINYGIGVWFVGKYKPTWVFISSH